ncbi:hypothetical protein B0H14DRAFT_3678124 [Mycena olivaceomarginata]|nr:hypothetical protein B0H14DRAFT_3678124 [Mycena olivaceomarginata]
MLGRIALFLSHRLALTNFTIDDASPAVVYTETPIIQCGPNSCPPGRNPFNGTATLTQGPIIVTFVGTPFTTAIHFKQAKFNQAPPRRIQVYVFLAVSGGCNFTIDGVDVGSWGAQSDGVTQLAYHNTSLLTRPHVLISPAISMSLIELDYIIYTTDVPTHKPRIGAIVGGAIGGVLALTLLGSCIFPAETGPAKENRGEGIRLGEGGGGEQDKSSWRRGPNALGGRCVSPVETGSAKENRSERDAGETSGEKSADNQINESKNLHIEDLEKELRRRNNQLSELMNRIAALENNLDRNPPRRPDVKIIPWRVLNTIQSLYWVSFYEPHLVDDDDPDSNQLLVWLFSRDLSGVLPRFFALFAAAALIIGYWKFADVLEPFEIDSMSLSIPLRYLLPLLGAVSGIAFAGAGGILSPVDIFVASIGQTVAQMAHTSIFPHPVLIVQTGYGNHCGGHTPAAFILAVDYVALILMQSAVNWPLLDSSTYLPSRCIDTTPCNGCAWWFCVYHHKLHQNATQAVDPWAQWRSGPLPVSPLLWY